MLPGVPDSPLMLPPPRMNWFRSSWCARLTSALLAFGLLLSLARPAAVATGEEQEMSRVEWLRTQLHTPDDPLVEAALEHAAAAPEAPMEAFVSAFAEAYLALAPLDASLAAVFDVQAADEAVLDVLQQRFQRLSGEQMAPLLLMAATPSSTSSAQYRLDLGPPLALATAGRHLMRQPGHLVAQGAQVLAYAFRLYSSARSLGP